ncbi:outer membrane protein assembly factor BamB family protein [Euhalothece natronophila]|uniref:outer membrane protein assembly factor BamB family protein n=1 Tax=Euhalothece natronophila TaxID=577489 RepID=UPI0016495853|nr:PQQ-binding-like beta-propeller repeat protein [Euhalothece natronophila]
MTTLLTKTGERIQLVKALAQGGEGEIWKTSKTGYLAKIYQHPTRERIEKLQVMLNYPPRDPNASRNHISFAWPLSLLEDSHQKPVGFLMPAIEGGRELLQVYSPRLRKQNKLEVDWRFLHVTALNVASIIQALHYTGYVLGDIKPQNILVNNRALPSIIDTDSFQVRDPDTGKIHRCPVASEDYTPVELIGKDITKVQQDEVQDRFRLAVIIHCLLFGNTPFHGKWVGQGEQPQPTELVKQGWWPYAENSLIQPSYLTIPLDVVHPSLKSCFLRAFNEGQQNPSLRPSAGEWKKVLEQAVEELKECPKKTLHVFSSHDPWGECYWCQRSQQLGVDIFYGKDKLNQQQPVNQAKVQPKTIPNSTTTSSKANSVTTPSKTTAQNSNLPVSNKKQNKIISISAISALFITTTIAIAQLTNEVLWQFPTDADVSSSPAVSERVVYFDNDDNHLYAVDVETGQEIWNFQTRTVLPALSSPAVAEGVIYFGRRDNRLYAVDVETGQEVWNFQTDDDVRSSPAVSEGVVYFGSDDNRLYAVDVETGQEVWNFQTDDDVHSSPAVSEGVVYFGSWDNHLYAVDVETGQELWNFPTEGSVGSSPAVSEGVVYFGSGDNHLYAVDVETGEEIWNFPTEGSVGSSPTVSEGVVYFGSYNFITYNGHLYAVDVETGEEIWNLPTDGLGRSSPAVAEGVIYFGSRDNHLYAVDVETGEEIWNFPTEGWVRSSPTVSEGVVYFGSNDNHLYAVDVETEQELWNFQTDDNVRSSPTVSE